MRFSASSNDLIPAFQLVSKAVSPKSSLPVLTGIFMGWENDTLRLVATDLELGIEAFVNVKSESSGKVVLPEKYITEIVRRVPTETVQFFFDDEAKSMNIVSGEASFTIKTLDASDFPLFQRLEKGDSFSINESILKRAIRYTSFAAAVNDSRRFLTGCYSTFDSEGVTFVGTNAYRLAKMTIKTDIQVSHQVSVIIPAKTLNHLERFLEDSDDAVVVTVDDRQVMFQKGNTTFVSRLIDGSYPDYKRIIPSSFAAEVDVERDGLFHSIERAALFAGDHSSGVKLEIADGSMEISSRSTEVGSLSDKIPVEKQGEDLGVVLRWQYLTDVLRLLKDELVRVRFAGKVKPICLQEQTDEYDYLYLIMPFNTES